MIKEVQISYRAIRLARIYLLFICILLFCFILFIGDKASSHKNLTKDQRVEIVMQIGVRGYNEMVADDWCMRHITQIRDIGYKSIVTINIIIWSSGNWIIFSNMPILI